MSHRPLTKRQLHDLMVEVERKIDIDTAKYVVSRLIARDRSRSRLSDRNTQLMCLGAIGALQELLDHCRSHTIPIDEDVVYKYLEATRKIYNEG